MQWPRMTPALAASLATIYGRRQAQRQREADEAAAKAEEDAEHGT